MSLQDADFLFFGNSHSSSLYYKQRSINTGAVVRLERVGLLLLFKV